MAVFRKSNSALKFSTLQSTSNSFLNVPDDTPLLMEEHPENQDGDQSADENNLRTSEDN